MVLDIAFQLLSIVWPTVVVTYIYILVESSEFKLKTTCSATRSGASDHEGSLSFAIQSLALLLLLVVMYLHFQLHIREIYLTHRIDKHVARKVNVEPAKPSHLRLMLHHRTPHNRSFLPIQYAPV